ncbi:hypothetical protein [Pseudonocardia humida]|uniref:Integral membrane protein n=1 Tax=Pseudonocardia humida TaxID=2800819 RepID=A0ABT1AAW9_9PSEU|nr:hypothetical protein [Pseudonocardia humida]MCO1660148.1 hypothetical protein [Pseudonocardia humida]
MDTLTRPVRARRPVVSLWLLRFALTAHLLAVLVQPVLAGLFLTGDVDAIALHGVIGSALVLVTLITTAVAVGYVLGGRGRLWILPALVALFLVEGVQIGAGYAHELTLHVPLGVALAVLAALLAVWAWTPSAARARGAR